MSSDDLTSRLTLGLLHQVNNVLTGIYFNVEECRELLSPGEPMNASLVEMADALESLQRLIERTVDVNQSIHDDDHVHWDFEELVRAQLDLLRILLPKTAAIELHSPEAPACVFASEAVFRHLLLSLALLLRPSLPTTRTRIVLELECLETEVIVRFRSAPGESEPDGIVEHLGELQTCAAQFGWRVTADTGLALPRVAFED